jgi:hypothetical protein
MGLGRVLIMLGVALIVMGVLVTFAGRLPFRLGRLPGDIYIQGKHTSFYFPLATCLLLSVVFSLILSLFRRSIFSSKDEPEAGGKVIGR